MKKTSLLSTALIAIPTLIFVSLSLGYFTWTRHTTGYFFGEMLVYVGTPGIITWGISRFCKLKRSTSLLTFACLYVLFLTTACIERAKELDKTAAAIRELTKLYQTDTEAEVYLLQNKCYLTDTYSDWAPILDYVRKEVIFTHQINAEWQDACTTANVGSMLTFDTLCDQARLIESRKALETLYNRLIEIQRKSVNYYSNLYLILKDQPFKYGYLMQPRLKTCERDSELHVNYYYDYFDNQRHQLFIIDDLYLFLLSLDGNYGSSNDQMQFSNDIEVAKYDLLMSKIEQLSQQETEISNTYLQDQKTVVFS